MNKKPDLFLLHIMCRQKGIPITNGEERLKKKLNNLQSNKRKHELKFYADVKPTKETKEKAYRKNLYYEMAINDTRERLREFRMNLLEKFEDYNTIQKENINEINT